MASDCRLPIPVGFVGEKHQDKGKGRGRNGIGNADVMASRRKLFKVTSMDVRKKN